MARDPNTTENQAPTPAGPDSKSFSETFSETRSAEPSEGRTLAVDPGTKRIGLAVTDALGYTAQPLKTIDRVGGKRDLENIEKVVREFDAIRLVMGLPIDPSGQEGRAAESARRFADRLEKHLSIPVEFVDESFSTCEAEDVLLAADMSRAKRKKVIDKLAATIILQRWLERES